MNLRLIFQFVLFVLLVCCENKPVDPALWKIGNTQKKFQKVLDYYSEPQDSLKLQAALFLIENMDHHYSYQPQNGEEIDDFFRNIKAEASIHIPIKTKLYATLRREIINNAILKGLSDGIIQKPKYRKRLDTKTISPEFLIENIDYAFKSWDFPWARNYSFNEFCRYILPYRYGNEAPSSWRKSIFEQYKWVRDSVQNFNNPIEVAAFVNEQFQSVLSSCVELKKNGFILNVSNQMDAVVFASCVDQAGLGVCVMRALGIGAAVVDIPRWGRSNSGHETIGILGEENEWRCFNLGGPGPLLQNQPNPPKLFFKQFDRMEYFNPVLEDASKLLMNVKNLAVKVRAKPNDEIYLCVFGNLSWYPLSKGINMNPKVVFENVGIGKMMYLAAVKSRGKLIPVSEIFTTDKLGNITYHKPNHSKLLDEYLSRKNPGVKNGKDRIKDLVNGEFSIFDNKDLSNKRLLYKVDSTLKYKYNIIETPNERGKYFKYEFPQSMDSLFNGPAEITFYSTHADTLKKIEGKYFGSPQLSDEHINIMTDGDILTYVEVWDCQEDLEKDTGRFILRKDKQPIWIGMEVDTETIVTHVGICPRNDKNGVYPGMNYELFYWDDAWNSLGKKVAFNDSIHFDGIPENSVLWLRNLDEGKEERIFTLENGAPTWW